MIIEAVTVCIGYDDFLEETAKFNVGLLDRLIVVTSARDERTREVCRRHDIETLLTEDHRSKGSGVGAPRGYPGSEEGVPAGPWPLTSDPSADPFNKGRIVERALQHLSAGCWRLHLDADIVLPIQFRRLLEGADLDAAKIYGCDRVMIRSWEAWEAARRSGVLAHTYSNINMPKGFEIGHRWALHDTGYVPIGFFQLWHSQADEWRGRRVRRYPVSHGAAHRTDVQFALQWDRRDRELLPELLVAHLESEAAPLGANWRGRKTKRFGPPAAPNHRPARDCS